jgi:hypothetical protein
MIEGMTQEDHARADFWDAMAIVFILGFVAGIWTPVLLRILL